METVRGSTWPRSVRSRRRRTEPAEPVLLSMAFATRSRTTHGQSYTSNKHRVAKDKRSQRKVADSTTELDKTDGPSSLGTRSWP